MSHAGDLALGPLCARAQGLSVPYRVWSNETVLQSRDRYHLPGLVSWERDEMALTWFSSFLNWFGPLWIRVCNYLNLVGRNIGLVLLSWTGSRGFWAGLYLSSSGSGPIPDSPSPVKTDSEAILTNSSRFLAGFPYTIHFWLVQSTSPHWCGNVSALFRIFGPG